jgi:DNA helicase HerA-like ATPase
MGQRNCGKSYLAKRLATIWPRKIIIDPMSEYDERDGEIYFDFNSFARRLVEIKQLNQEKFTIIFQFDVESDISETEFDQVLRLAYYFGNVQVVIEEVHLFSSPHTLPKWLRNLALTGRHQNTALLLTTQRPGELNKTLVSQSTHIFCGRILESNDLRYVSAFLGQESGRLASLQDRKFLYFSSQGVQEITNDI